MFVQTYQLKIIYGLISTGLEYKKAENIISILISNINPDYTPAQKLAVLDYEIGKLISYSPDYDTEVFDEKGNRALWKILCTGYGVCNGISLLMQYILNRIGIKSDIVYSKNHAFLRLKNIELPLADGSIVKGDTILDTTWNLAYHRFNCKPQNFCISYEEARKNDIDDDGKDCECHKNDEELSDITLSLDDESLRSLFASVGLATKGGSFPVGLYFIYSEELANASKNDPDLNITLQFELLKKICPEFATCQNSTMRFIPTLFADNKHLHYKDFVINRVYDKSDSKKSPVLYVYIELDELGKRFYFADKNQGQMIELSQEEFEAQFECYEYDLKKSDGIRPWEKHSKQNEKNLSDQIIGRED